MTEIQMYDTNNIPSCNMSPETNAWNKTCLDYVNPIPTCNVSTQTNAWNKTCLDSIKE